MTLQDFFDICSDRPEFIGFFFVALPLTAFLAGIFGKGEGHLSPWKYLYSFLVYAATIPGIFAILLNVYFFLFERQPIMETNVYTQILPILIMVFTLWLIKRNVAFDDIPGFDRISGMMMVTLVILALMWVLDRTQIIAVTFMPFQQVLLILIGLLLVARWGMKRMFA